MTTPNDPYNSANPRPFNDDDILEPIVENTERLQPEYMPEQVAGESVEIDEDLTIGTDAPDFGETLAAHTEDTPDFDEPSAQHDQENNLPQTDTTHWGAPKYVNDANYSANEFADVEPREDLVDPDLPAQPRDRQMVANETPSNPNPTLGGYLNETEHSEKPNTETGVAMGVVAPAVPASPNRTSVMPAGEEEPNFAPPREEWSADPGDITEIPDEPKGRGWIHTGSFFLTLLLIPLAWYLISDAGARLYLVENNPWDAQTFAFFPFIELLGGLVVLAMLWLTARASSLGAQFWGGLVTIAGMVALIVPSLGHHAVTWLDAHIGHYNDFTGNVVHHIELDLGTGRVVILGFLLFMTGVATHAARRRGATRAIAQTRREFLLNTASTPTTTPDETK